MALTRRGFMAATVAGLTAALAGCGRPKTTAAELRDPDEGEEKPSVDVHAYDALALPRDGWSWDKEHDVYYQLALASCLDPVSRASQSLSIFVPGAYFSAEAHGDTYACTVDETGAVNGRRATDAPVVFAVDCPDWAGQRPSATYSYAGLEPYMEAGCVYVFPGCRGRSDGYDTDGSGDKVFPGGLPWNAADLKAAVRFLRYNAAALPGGAKNVVALGFGAGACLAAILGTTGDAEDFDPYLDEVGAALWDAEGAPLSDALAGAALWCPPLAIATMDSAYEWLYGRFSLSGSRDPKLWTSALSRDLARAYGTYVDGLGLVDGEGAALSLEETTDGTASAGSYQDAVVAMVERAGASFFERAAFPLTVASTERSGAGFPGSAAAAFDTDELAQGAQEAAAQAAEAGVSIDLAAEETPKATSSTSYPSASSYVRALNGDDPWLFYSPASASVRVGDLGGFVRACAPASLECTAYDAVAKDSVYNQLLGVPGQTALHFSAQVYDLVNHNQWDYRELSGWDPRLPGDWAVDLRVKGVVGRTPVRRAALCDPVGRLTSGADGTVAPVWRVNVGLSQSRVPFTESLNLAAALEARDGCSVALTAVWDGGYDLCEDTGDPVANVLAWVGETAVPPKDDGDA